MTGLRLEIDLEKISVNAQVLVDLCGARGISVTGVTKAMLGAPELARALQCLEALGDSRIENIERMRHAGVESSMVLLRAPMPSQIDRIVDARVTSLNTETGALSALSSAGRVAGQIQKVIVMVELGDLREGLMPEALNATIRHITGLSHVHLTGIGANLACRSGIEPSNDNMAALSTIVDATEATFGVSIDMVSGGNSANLDWLAATGDVGRINNLRLGESILLGTEPLHRRPLAGLSSDAIVLVAEVIESQRKPTKPWGAAGQNSFGETPCAQDRGDVWQTIFAVGRQDTDTADLEGPEGIELLAASSDHLVTATTARMSPGEEVRFRPGYSALLRSMTSPFVNKCMSGR